MTNDLDVIHTWLQSSYSVQVPPDWLSACVEWIQQENGGHPLPVARLQAMVFEQWLMSDLKELGAACLPADLSSQHCVSVSGPLALQVESMLDVGIPLYGQLQKVKGTLNANSEVSADKPQQPPWEPKSSRMMLLKMTDGQTEVKAMEYRPIPALNSGLQPGFKVVIHGQVKCRRGMLMLTGDNVQVLGGEVDSLIEANTPVAVLEQAMELGKTNNGKHAKMEFSGRFLKKQDFKTGCQDKKFKTEVTSSLPGQGFDRGRNGTGVAGYESYCHGDGVKKEPQSQSLAWKSGTFGVKQEPPSQPQALDPEDEWEEDLDYGGLLDEPMEDDLPPRPEPPASTSAAPQDSGPPPPKRNPFACASATATAKPEPSWQEQCSSNQSGSWKSEGMNKRPATTQQNPSVKTVIHSEGKQGVNQTSSWQKNSPVVVDESMWGDDDDDDDFAMEQLETDVLSPVIPVQTPLDQDSWNAKTSDSGINKQTGSQKLQNSLVSDTSSVKPLLKSVSFAARTEVSSTAKTDVSSTAKSSSLLQSAPKTAVTSISKPQKPSESTKPPPPKQRKLTAMFQSAKVESKAVVSSSTHSQPVSDTVVDLTEDRAVPSAPETDAHCATVKEMGNLKEGKEELTADAAQVSQTTGSGGESRDVDIVEESCVKGEQPAAPDIPQETLPHAVIQPLNSQGEVVSPQPEPQLLKDVLSVLQSGAETGRGHTFTIKGHIATLTDRLRSCQGEQWSLSCRITDGSAALEIAIADKMLAQLIGITAKESITLRTQARKDASLKEFLTQGLQKCQKYLAEFSGLMDIQRGEGDSKPWLVNMVKLETKKR